VFDPEAYVGQTHVTPPERAALAELQALGLHDVVRDRWPGERVFTTGTTGPACSTRTSGMRIDLILAGGRWRSACGGLGRPAGAQGQRAERPRAGDRRPGRGAGRRHRAGGAAAVDAGHKRGAKKLPQA
jgi:hypothetical protein